MSSMEVKLLFEAELLSIWLQNTISVQKLVIMVIKNTQLFTSWSNRFYIFVALYFARNQFLSQCGLSRHIATIDRWWEDHIPKKSFKTTNPIEPHKMGLEN